MLASEIESGKPFRDWDTWPIYAKYARECGRITTALDAWLPTARHQEVEAHWAALATRSAAAKQHMIRGLGRGWPSWAAKALIEGWGVADPEVAAALEAASSTTETARELAPCIPDFVPGRDEARRRLLRLLPDAGYRLGFVLRGLARCRGPAPEPEVVTATLDQLDQDFSSGARTALFEHWSDDPRVADRALAELEGNDDTKDLTAIALAARRAPQLRAPILRAIGVLPARLRHALAERLEPALRDRAAAAAVASYPHEPNPAVRTRCAMLHHARARTPNEEDVALLQREVTKTGPGVQEAREAAFAALLRINRLDLFLSATESSGAPLCLRGGWSRGYNAPFWAEVAENWALLRSNLGDSIFRRLASTDDGNPETWDALSIVAPRSTELGADVVDYARRAPPGRLGANTLRFVARELPRSALLRDLLLQNMERGVRELWWGVERYEDSAVVALELLAEGFGSDKETLALVAPRFPWEGAPPVLRIVAMASGWSDSDEFERLYTHLRTNKIQLGPLGYAAVVAVKSEASLVVKLLTHYDEFASDVRRPDLRVSTRLLVRRLREDHEVYAEAKNALRAVRGPDLVALLRLLVTARGIGDLRAPIQEIVRGELDGRTAPMLVNEPFTGVALPASTILLDALLGR